MVFSSALFLFAFLPFVLLMYHLCPQRSKNLCLLAASILFYAWGEPVYCVIMFGSIAVNYSVGRWIGSCQEARRRKLALTVGILGNLSCLAWFKYSAFLASVVGQLLAPFGLADVALEPAHLPIGISFFTFQATSYLIDVFRGQTPAQGDWVQLALYISLFPQLVAGPIVRYNQIATQLEKRARCLSDVALGARRFTIGLGKKILIADVLAGSVDPIFALEGGDRSAAVAWLGAIGYALQIYFDFSGYSDMAIGLGRMLGFTFPENFRSPYAATSITDFWRRWHISLSRWFRDYLYIPLGGNRHGVARTYFNLALVFLLCGLWHGAAWNFVVWGGLHGCLLILERRGLLRTRIFAWAFMRWAYCSSAVLLAWVVFRTDSLGDSAEYLRSLVSTAPGLANHSLDQYLDRPLVLALLAGFIAALPWDSWLEARRRNGASRDDSASHRWLAFDTIELLAMASILGACACRVAANTHSPFLYFRF